MADAHPLDQPGAERFTIRQKVFKIFGAAFHIYDQSGNVIGYCKQKAFKLREDLRFYTDESLSSELFSMRARSILDFSTTYDIAGSDGEVMGSIRRKGLASFLRDSWLVFGPNDEHIADLREDSGGMAMARRVIPLFSAIFPQRFDLVTTGGTSIASYQTRFNPFIYKLDVQLETDSPEIDLYVVLAMGCLLAAIEGRQGSNSSGSGFMSGD